MRRLISISMVAVLAGWLAMPLAGAHFSACNMMCCRRTVAKPHCSHMEDMEASGRCAERTGSLHRFQRMPWEMLR